MRGCNDERGSTLAESLVALSLFGLMAAAITDLLITHIRVEGSNIRRTTAIALTEQEFEDLRSLKHDDIESRTSTQRIEGRTYTIATVAQPDTPASNMTSITATVSWIDESGSQTYTANVIYTPIQR